VDLHQKQVEIPKYNPLEQFALPFLPQVEKTSSPKQLHIIKVIVSKNKFQENKN
jgi:hypothetical protein